jgi:hypothetical protein
MYRGASDPVFRILFLRTCDSLTLAIDVHWRNEEYFKQLDEFRTLAVQQIHDHSSQMVDLSDRIHILSAFRTIPHISSQFPFGQSYSYTCPNPPFSPTWKAQG